MRQIRQMTYRPRRTEDVATSAVEVMTFDRLRRANDGGTQRADFHVLAMIESGAGVVSVDFADHRLAGRVAVWIRPGEVHRWIDIADVSGRVVLFVPTAPVTPRTRALAGEPGRQCAWTVDPDAWPLILTAVDHLEAEADAAAGTAVQEVPPILLSALVARLSPPLDHDPALQSTTFRRFQALVEARFRQHHDAGHYAHALGYAPRTLSRHVQQATGRTAKTYIVDRIVLEAKRLLAHDLHSAARCAAELGFVDASSFSLFFKRATGQPPAAWQTAHSDPAQT